MSDMRNNTDIKVTGPLIIRSSAKMCQKVGKRWSQEEKEKLCRHQSQGVTKIEHGLLH